MHFFCRFRQYKPSDNSPGGVLYHVPPGLAALAAFCHNGRAAYDAGWNTMRRAARLRSSGRHAVCSLARRRGRLAWGLWRLRATAPGKKTNLRRRTRALPPIARRPALRAVRLRASFWSPAGCPLRPCAAALRRPCVAPLYALTRSRPLFSCHVCPGSAASAAAYPLRRLGVGERERDKKKAVHCCATFLNFYASSRGVPCTTNVAFSCNSW